MACMADDECSRYRAAVQEALHGATLVDSIFTVEPDGWITVDTLMFRLLDGRIVGIHPPPRASIAVGIDNDQHPITMRDFGRNT